MLYSWRLHVLLLSQASMWVGVGGDRTSKHDRVQDNTTTVVD